MFGFSGGSKPPLGPGHEGSSLNEARYEIMSQVGSGSYGVVRKAKDKNKPDGDPDQIVAVKEIKGVFQSRTDAKRTLRELVILRQCNHTAIVKLLDIIQPTTQSFSNLSLVFPYFSMDISQLLLTIGQQPGWAKPHVQYLMFQMLSGVAYLHSRSIVHRDLKPSNLLANEACELKICDFGLARSLITQQQLQSMARQDRPSAVALNRQLTQHVVTRWYRAPELIMKADAYNFSVDIWSVGCILGEMLQSLEQGRRVRPMFPGDASNLSCGTDSPMEEGGGDEGGMLSGGLERDAQLLKILNVMGTPSPEQLAQFKDLRSRAVLSKVPSKPPQDLATLLPAADGPSLQFVRDMLAIDPDTRCTAAEGLRHQFFDDMPADWRTMDGSAMDGPFEPDPIDLEFEYAEREASTSELRARLLSEVDWHLTKYHNASAGKG